MANISPRELELKLAQAASTIVSKEDAGYFAKEVIEAHIRKAPRSNVVSGAIKDIKASKDAKPLIYTIDLPSYFSIDFQTQGPLVYLKSIHDELENRAHQNGLAMVAFTNSKSMHTLHTWVQGLAKRGLLAIAVCNGGPRSVIPHNGTSGIFGTNPIAYGIPNIKDDITCVDMATSEIPYFAILDAKKNKTSLPEGAAVDEEGQPTTDASKALDYSVSEIDPTSNLTPMGAGYKGYNLVYLLEILSSGLIGMPASTQMSPDFIAEEHGAILIAISPKAFGTAQSLQESLDSLNAVITQQKPKAGTSIRIPGQGNAQKYKANKDQSIQINDDLLKQLTDLL